MVLPSAIAAAVSVKAVSPQERASSNAGPHNLPAVATLQFGCMCYYVCLEDGRCWAVQGSMLRIDNVFSTSRIFISAIMSIDQRGVDFVPLIAKKNR